MRTAGAHEFPIPEIRRFGRHSPVSTELIVPAAAWDETGGRILGHDHELLQRGVLDPPLVLLQVDRRALSLESRRRVPGYAVNVLADHQRALSERFFARPRADKWLGVEFSTAAPRPLLRARCALEMRAHSQYEAESSHHSLRSRDAVCRGEHWSTARVPRKCLRRHRSSRASGHRKHAAPVAAPDSLLSQAFPRNAR